MLLTVETRQLMTKMHDFVRSDAKINIPGIKPDRMLHYRRLIRNVFEETLSKAFPITVEVLTDEEWAELVETFMLKARPQSPFIWKMPFEFYEFVANEDFAAKFHRPYLDDLLFFEWIEIELFTMPDGITPKFRDEGDFLEETIIVNPDHQILELEYPVHKMPADEAVNHQAQYFILTFREQTSGAVKFVEINPLLAFVWQELAKTPQSGHQLIQNMVKILPDTSKETMVSILLPFFNDMLLQGAVLGFSS